ncbi:uncharacterized protein LOC124419130 [Lucilia cuprina]|uniref:uncharacterized protein LOC124419130 n=1 Tax=Lucilia cuprina TaxID=7375 RepID=UPI001F063B27|nr:uncharacterized protein LOC124419130 [Lucilia cuprina]
MSYCNAFDSSLFGNCLRDLSVSELLTLKHSMQTLQHTEELVKKRYSNPQNIQCPETSEEKCEKPSTMALVAEQRGYAVSHPSYESWQHEEKPSKLQTLFHISVTALAFLSFGGYLLCLIVQSIKSKGTTYFHTAATTMATTTGTRRIKIYRRSRRSSLPPMETTQNYNYYNQYNSYNNNNPYQYYKRKYSEYV